uniref:C-type lectin domain-containing protein n=1 Tax=Labrus bergylta TaxID=56723 RepID=A0A3Q3E7X4_9LABR
MEKMQTLLNEYKFSFVWIGLRSGKSLNWHWSLAQKDSFKGEMDDLIQRDETGGDCGTYKNGKFTASECTNKFHAVCFDEKGPQQYILTPQKMNWRVAQEHCRRQHTDLASVRNKEENHALQEVVGDQKVWTGLFRDPWEWSDGSDSSFRYWKTDMQIYNDPSNKCTALNDDRFYIRACGFKLKFLCTCEKGLGRSVKKIVKVRISSKDSGLDLNDPAIKEDILKQIKQQMRGTNVTSIQWRTNPDGRVFVKEPEKKQRSEL